MVNSIEFYEDKIKKLTPYMLEKFIQNDNKGSWENCTNYYLINRLIDEIEELIEAIAQEKEIKDIRSECADIANFVVMINDNYTKQKLNEKLNIQK